MKKYLKLNVNVKKKEIIVDSSKRGFSPMVLLEHFYALKKYTNYKVLKCFQLVFDFNRLKKILEAILFFPLY